MRNKVSFCMLLAAMALLFIAVAAGSSDRRDEMVGYNVLAERVFEGSVESKPYVIEQMVYFPLRTADSVVHVQVGPKDFVEHSGFKIKAGDKLTVTGMPIMMSRREVVLAREVRSMNGVLVVRDPVGLPVWESDRPIQMDPLGQKGFLQLVDVIK